MSLVVVADSDLRERMRCVGLVSGHASAVGAATWSELEQLLDDGGEVKLVIYAGTFEDAPEDALERVQSRAARLVIAEGRDTSVPESDRVARTQWPMDREHLIGEARSIARSSPPGERSSYVPLDFLQMLCMSGGSAVLLVSRDGQDVGAIEVRTGILWTAFDRLSTGEEAFTRLIHPSHRGRVSHLTETKKERSIRRSLMDLALDSLSRIDEGKVQPPPPVTTAQLETALSSDEELCSEVKRLNDEARGLLVARDYEKAAQVLNALSDLDPSSPLVRANLEQLRRLGFAK